MLLFQETGWIAQHIVARDECNTVLGVVPLYLKRSCNSIVEFICTLSVTTHIILMVHVFLAISCSHSYGEYVFDHSWANAYYGYGARYYPKLQCCVPFTPVTGQRILLRNTLYKDKIFDILVSAMKDLTTKVL